MFATGGRGQQLILRTNRFFLSDNMTLHSGEGPIYSIKWRGDLIAWANNQGVKFYDTNAHKPIAHIKRSKKGSPDPETYRCCLCWADDTTLLIGWGDWVKIGKINFIKTPENRFIKEVSVTNVFITDYYICGIAPFQENLVILAFVEGLCVYLSFYFIVIFILDFYFGFFVCFWVWLSIIWGTKE